MLIKMADQKFEIPTNFIQNLKPKIVWYLTADNLSKVDKEKRRKRAGLFRDNGFMLEGKITFPFCNGSKDKKQIKLPNGIFLSVEHLTFASNFRGFELFFAWKIKFR